MRYITELELRDRFAHGVPDAFEPAADEKLTPAARQYLIDLRLYKSTEKPAQSKPLPTASPTLGGAPTLPINGSKPEHMTHLTRSRLTCKADPRIELRGRLDSLEAELLLTELEAPADFVAPLEDALLLVRQTLASDVKEQPLPDWLLDGMTAEQVHRASHHPEEFGFKGHIMPDVKQGRFAALLNRLRTMTRECEVCAVRAFWRDDRLERGDIVLTLNRLSSYFYVLQLRAAQGKE